MISSVLMEKITHCPFCGNIFNEIKEDDDWERLICNCDYRKSITGCYFNIDVSYINNKLAAYWVILPIDVINFVVNANSSITPYRLVQPNTIVIGEITDKRFILYPTTFDYFEPSKFEDIEKFARRVLKNKMFL